MWCINAIKNIFKRSIIIIIFVDVVSKRCAEIMRIKEKRAISSSWNIIVVLKHSTYIIQCITQTFHVLNTTSKDQNNSSRAKRSFLSFSELSNNNFPHSKANKICVFQLKHLMKELWTRHSSSQNAEIFWHMQMWRICIRWIWIVLNLQRFRVACSQLLSPQSCLIIPSTCSWILCIRMHQLVKFYTNASKLALDISQKFIILLAYEMFAELCVCFM